MTTDYEFVKTLAKVANLSPEEVARRISRAEFDGNSLRISSRDPKERHQLEKSGFRRLYEKNMAEKAEADSVPEEVSEDTGDEDEAALRSAAALSKNPNGGLTVEEGQNFLQGLGEFDTEDRRVFRNNDVTNRSELGQYALGRPERISTPADELRFTEDPDFP